MQDIKEWIKKHEGFRLKPYQDSVGKLTIGYGRNLDDNGITASEANFIFENDFFRCQEELKKYNWYSFQPDHVKAALINMCFNMGITRLCEFKRMIMAINARDYTKAAKELLDSKWANQVGYRAAEIALMMRGGLNI